MDYTSYYIGIQNLIYIDFFIGFEGEVSRYMTSQVRLKYVT